MSSVLADSLIVPECIYRPGSFTGLMTIYESNYLKMQQLGGFANAGAKTDFSAVPGDCDLHMEVLRREPYTTTLRLTYWFEEPDGAAVADPDIVLRAYHDARLVEAVASTNQHRHHRLKQLAMTHAAELDRRWQRNITLNKWLDYLLDMGHGFR
jgi:uncharacterized protein YqiB (DUF1249 family)